MLRKDDIHLTDNDTKIFAANLLNYLNINLENAINFNVDFHNSESMLDWQQQVKASLGRVNKNWRPKSAGNRNAWYFNNHRNKIG